MATPEISGMCFDILLVNGLPDCNVFDGLISTLDVQLAENEAKLEQCLKDFAKSELTDTRDIFEILKLIKAENCVPQSTCDELDLQKVLKLIKQWIDFLESTPDSESALMLAIFHLSSCEGLVLPECCSPGSTVTESMVSLHGTVDTQEYTVSAAWNKLCLQLHHRVMQRIETLPDCCHSNSRHQLISGLQVIFPSTQVLSQYRNLRQRQLKQCIHQQLRASEGTKKQTFETLVFKFSQLMSKVFAMMSEDFELFISGTFEELDFDYSFDFLGEIYFDHLQDEVEAAVEKLSRELSSLPDSSKKRGSKSDKSSVKTDDSVTMCKSPSDVGFLGRHFSSLGSRRSRSHSADDLDDGKRLSTLSADGFSDLSRFDAQRLEAVVKFVGCLLDIDQYLETRLSSVSSSWHNVVDVGHERKPRCHLKSAIKGCQRIGSQLKRDAKPVRKTSHRMKRDSVKNLVSLSDVDSVPLLKDASMSDRMRFDWRTSVSKLITDLSCAITSVLHSISRSALCEDSEWLDKTGVIRNIVVLADVIDIGSDRPSQVSASSWSLFKELQRLLPLAIAGKEHPLLALRAAFVEALTNSLEAIADWFNMLSTEQLDKWSVNLFYIVLSSSAFWRLQLIHFEAELSPDSSSKKLLDTVSHQFQQVIERLIDQIIQRHCCLLVTSVLCDAESHNWSDNKEFFEVFLMLITMELNTVEKNLYLIVKLCNEVKHHIHLLAFSACNEVKYYIHLLACSAPSKTDFAVANGERYSFDIQAWNLYMRGLQADLWSSCTRCHSQRIFAGVLKGSLSHFAWRYTRAQPSRRRMTQFVADITTILLCTSEFLLVASNSVAMLLDPCESDGDTFAVHNYCCTLLATLAILGSPIDILYRVYRKGFTKKSTHTNETVPKGRLSQWLHWIRPSLLPSLCTNDEQNCMAIYLQLCLLNRRLDDRCYYLLLQSLLMEDCALSVMLLGRLSDITNNSLGSIESSNAIKIFTALVDILCKCSDFPCALSVALQPVVDRYDDWNMLGKDVIFDKTVKCSIWFTAIEKQLSEFNARVVENGVLLLTDRKPTLLATAPASLYQIHGDFTELPCGCPISTPLDTDPSNDVKDPVSEAVSSVISELTQLLFMIPQPALILMRTLQDNSAEKSQITTNSNCQLFGLKILVCCLRRTLLDFEYLSTTFSCVLSDETKTKLEFVAHCVYHALLCPNQDDSADTPEPAKTFIQANGRFLSEQIEAINCHISNHAFKTSTQHPLTHATTYFAETLLQLQIESVTHTRTGATSLAAVYQFIVNNFDWIAKNLDIAPLLPSGGNDCNDTSPSSLLFDEFSSAAGSDFNPLTAFNHITGSKFDQTAIMKFNHNWLALLQSDDLGISRVGFQTLLFRRHDMQKGALIEDGEKRLVEALSKKFDRDGSATLA